MASQIPGYEYDIFISYRQKDNKGDKWVSEFVESLKTELESTFKEEISVYFDINPHDGLLETHDVDESLKDKLKCLVFIPIISRTYCDPKSFAWEHEFKAFIEQVSKDQFGLKVKLPNGNVASRVLPIRIHDLDPEDIKECESVLGGVLRGIEFIYKEAGIDKPLAPDDDEKRNLNNTKYRIQIIKVAHSIKEIILGMKIEPSKLAIEGEPKESEKVIKKDEKRTDLEESTKSGKFKVLIPSAIVVLLIVAGIIAFPKINKNRALERLRSSGDRISVAVMPFQGINEDTSTYNIGDWIQDGLINYLSDFSDKLIIKQSESVNYLIQNIELSNPKTLTPTLASEISRKLNADILITGSIRITGTDIKITSQIIDSNTEEVLKAFEKGPVGSKKVDSLINSVRTDIADYLILSILKRKDFTTDHTPITKEAQSLISTNSPIAYNYFSKGVKAFAKQDYPTAVDYFLQALDADSTFTFAAILISWAYSNQGLYKKAREWNLKVYNKKEMLPLILKLRVMNQYASYMSGPQERMKFLKQQLDIDDEDVNALGNLGSCYSIMGQFENTILVGEKLFEIYKNWGVKGQYIADYIRLGRAYHQMGQFRKEKKIYKLAEELFPDNRNLIYRQAILSLSEGDSLTAATYIKKLETILKESSFSEADLIIAWANIYYEADLLIKAEEYYRKALALEPENLARVYSLAYFLIDKNRSVNEGLEFADTLLKSYPENYTFLHCKGWGLYKQRKYEEALEILQKSWELRMNNAVFNYEAFQHLEAAKKAVDSLKMNQ